MPFVRLPFFPKSEGLAILKCCIPSALKFSPLYSPCMSNKIEFAIGNLAICSIILATHHDFPEPVLPTITACRWNSLSPSKNASAFSSIEYFPIERGI